MSYKRDGFTIAELLIAVIVIGILAAIAVASYGEWRQRTASTAIRNDLIGAATTLAANMNYENNYPPNMSGIDFTPSEGIALVIYTDAPTNGVYQSLTPEQNAQLLLNVCNANLNGLYNTVCTFAGKGGGAKIHVKGTHSTNTHWPNPITADSISLPFGPEYEAAANAIIEQFNSQGGTFPAVTSGSPVALPDPTLVPVGQATNYCLEGRSGLFPGIAFHITPGATDATEGTCPEDSSLHYIP